MSRSLRRLITASLLLGFSAAGAHAQTTDTDSTSIYSMSSSGPPVANAPRSFNVNYTATKPGRQVSVSVFASNSTYTTYGQQVGGDTYSV